MGPIHVAGCTTKTAVSRRRQRLSRGVRPNDEGSCYSQIWTALSGHDRQRSAWPAPAITSHRQPVRLSAGAVSAAFDANGQPQQIWSIADDAATLPAEGWSCETTLGHRALYVRALCRAGNSAGRPRPRQAVQGDGQLLRNSTSAKLAAVKRPWVEKRDSQLRNSSSHFSLKRRSLLISLPGARDNPAA